MAMPTGLAKKRGPAPFVGLIFSSGDFIMRCSNQSAICYKE